MGHFASNNKWHRILIGSITLTIFLPFSASTLPFWLPFQHFSSRYCYRCSGCAFVAHANENGLLPEEKDDTDRHQSVFFRSNWTRDVRNADAECGAEWIVDAKVVAASCGQWEIMLLLYLRFGDFHGNDKWWLEYCERTQVPDDCGDREQHIIGRCEYSQQTAGHN